MEMRGEAYKLWKLSRKVHKESNTYCCWTISELFNVSSSPQDGCGKLRFNWTRWDSEMGGVLTGEGGQVEISSSLCKPGTDGKTWPGVI